jgi:SAM-dependent methyltransferase
MYRELLARLRAGEGSLFPIEREEIGDVAGAQLLHLQCHIGVDTLSLAQLGAEVTGVDFSPDAITAARRLADELGISATFVQSNVLELDLGQEFDVVFTSYGTITWLGDLRCWGEVIARHLRPGGTFYMVDCHPFRVVIDWEGTKRNELRILEDYFTDGEPVAHTVEGSYAGPEVVTSANVEVEWMHTMSEIVNVLAGAGLHIDFLNEHAVSTWASFPCVRRCDDGWYRLPPELRNKLPLLFSLKATKPA